MNAKVISFITIFDAIQFHDDLIQEFGGRSGVHDKGLLDSAIAQPLRVLDYGSEVERKITFLAATYFYHIIKNHPFVDGNKRTALAVAMNFLEKNGYHFNHEGAKLFELLYRIAIETAASQHSKEDIADIFKNILKQ